MANFTTFGEIVTKTRVMARQSPNPGVGSEANTRIKETINQTYETLYDSFDWPHLRYTPPRTVLVAGQRFYDMPAALNLNRIETAVTWWNEQPYDTAFGIGPREYQEVDSAGGETLDPVLRFDFRATGPGDVQIEVWPVPATSGGEIEFTGMRAWRRLVNTIDVCYLDDLVVSQLAAAIILDPISKDAAEQLRQQASLRLSGVRARANPPGTAEDMPRLGAGSVSVGLVAGRAVVRVSG